MRALDYRISIILIILGTMFFAISSQDVHEIQVPVTYYLYQQSSRLEAKHQWKISETINSQTSIIYGPFNAYSQHIDVVVLMLYASSPITVTIYGEKNGVIFVETSTNFTGTGAGLWVAIYPNDTYRIIISNFGISQSYINGEIGAGTIIIETNPVPYTSYYTQTVYGPFYSSRFLWIGIALLGVVIGIYAYLHRRAILQELKD